MIRDILVDSHEIFNSFIILVNFVSKWIVNELTQHLLCKTNETFKYSIACSVMFCYFLFAIFYYDALSPMSCLYSLYSLYSLYAIKSMKNINIIHRIQSYCCYMLCCNWFFSWIHDYLLISISICIIIIKDNRI